MNTTQTTKRQHRHVLAGFATIALTGALLAAPAATAGPVTNGPVDPEIAAPLDIVEQVLVRKLQIAQDRVDRPWAYR